MQLQANTTVRTIYGVPYTYWPLTRSSNRPVSKFRGGKARFITVHETANWNAGATARNTIRWLHNGASGQQLSFHDAVDDIEIIQGLRSDERGWHAGDGYAGTGNLESWGLEICVNATGARRMQTLENAAARVAYLLDHGHGRGGVFQHNHWSGKNCPYDMRAARPIPWDYFMRLVEERRAQEYIMDKEELRRFIHDEMAEERQLLDDIVMSVFGGNDRMQYLLAGYDALEERVDRIERDDGWLAKRLGTLITATYGDEDRLNDLLEREVIPVEARIDRMEADDGWLAKRLDELAATHDH